MNNLIIVSLNLVFNQIQFNKPDLRLNGKCNLECIMCRVWLGDNGRCNETTFWNDGPKEIFPFLLEIDMLGGEPFIQADTFKLIDQVSEVNKDCKWNFTTNGNWKLSGKIKKYLDKIKINVFTISVDAITPDTYLKIRKKGDFKKVFDTIEDLIVYRNNECPWMYLRLDFVVQSGNLNEILPFYKICIEKDLDPSYILLEYPKIFSIKNLDSKSLEIVQKETSAFINDSKAFALNTIHRNITEILSSRPRKIL
jgi:MoaA/NifB/PqqE/SkfB family radical SAM enzyme